MPLATERRPVVVPIHGPIVDQDTTRETELCEKFPDHVVTKWLGNTVAMARKHCLRTTDAHFEKAAKGVTRRHKKRRSNLLLMAATSRNQKPTMQKNP